MDTSLATLTATDQAPSRARSWVAQACVGYPANLVETVELLVTELVTNAVVHGRGDVYLGLSSDEHLIRVEVSDASPQPARLIQPDTAGDSGRGLLIVAALAKCWGSLPRIGAEGKTVWFELDL